MRRILSGCLLLTILLTCFCYANAAELTALEIEAANKVEYIADRQFFYYESSNEYVIMFSFLDKNENRIECPCTVEARLVNSEGSEVYTIKKQLSMLTDFSTWTWNSSLYASRNGVYGSIHIRPSDIALSNTATGTMFIKVYLDDYWSFSEAEIEVDELPTIQSKLGLPSLPKTITKGSTKAIKITNITYEFDKHNYDEQSTLIVYLTGEMTKGSKTTASSSQIGWRLLDDDDYIIDSGIWFTDELTVGDKFKNKDFSIYNVSTGSYTLELRNVQ